MSSLHLAAYGASAIAVILIGSSYVYMLSRDLDVELVITTMRKLLGEKNLDRAHRLTRAAPHSVLDVLRAGIEAVTERPPAERYSVERDARIAFDAAGASMIAQRRKRIDRVYAGILIAALPFAVEDLPVWSRVLQGATVLAGVWMVYRRKQFAHGMRRLRDEVLPLVVEAAASPVGAADAPYRALVRPAAAKPGTSLRDGNCPLCAGTAITHVDSEADTRFHKLLCAACGYTQEFADLGRR